VKATAPLLRRPDAAKAQKLAAAGRMKFGAASAAVPGDARSDGEARLRRGSAI